jgi:hypothetical protein
MSSSSVIDDIANRNLIEPVLSQAAERELSLEWLLELACGQAANNDRERYGRHWLRTLLDLLERGGVGHLERRDREQIVFVFADVPPSAEEAWERAWSAARRR